LHLRPISTDDRGESEFGILWTSPIIIGLHRLD